MLGILPIVVTLEILMYVSAVEDMCIIHLEKVNCSDKEKSELHYVCESKIGGNCSCVFDNPFLTETGWFKACHSKNLRNVKKKKVRKRQIRGYIQIVGQNPCGTIGPPKPGKVSCSISRTDIKCTGRCDIEHEFIDGTKEISTSCLYSDGVWIPIVEFPPCKPKCNPPCENGGTCQEGNFCLCTYDYRGNACQYPITLCAISKNKFASYWTCNHTRSETTCDISCHPPDTIDAELDVTRYSCTEEGIWTPELPPCVQIPTCGKPNDIQHRRWQLSIGHILSTGSQIVYNCDNGYILQGEKYSNCNENRTWSNEAPVCILQNVNICEDPGNIIHGQRNISSVIFLEGSSIAYECFENYALLGDPVITCMNNGQWSSRKPHCVPKEHAPAFCSKPNAPKNSFVRLKFPDRIPLRTVFIKDIPLHVIGEEDKDFTTLGDRTFVVGTRVQYKCKSRFYRLYGSEYQTCQSSRTWSGYQPACIPECGKSDTPKTPFIVNGNSSHIGQWPWQVGLAVKTNTGLHLLCGGVLISELWILTAAHCVTKKLSNIPMATTDLLIFCGKYFRHFDRDDEYVQVKRVRQIVIHEEYDFVHFDVDIALVQLENPVELTTRVKPICLPTEDTTRENVRDGKIGIVTGWGLTENGKFSETLKETLLPVVSHNTCEEAYREGLRRVTVTRNMFCAGHESGNTDTCNGDSGGPMMFAVGPANDNRWYLEGIVSWGSESGCGKSQRYSGFTKVGRFVPWINMHM